jgi:cytoskeletal protein CcmA (bactofilin family)
MTPPASSAPLAGPAIPPPGAPASSPPAPPPLAGTLADRGGARHDAVRTAEWSIDGATKVLGSAEVGFLRGRGVLTVGGALSGADVQHDGSLTVLGTTRVAGPLRLTGEVRLQADAQAGEMELTGRLEARGDLTVARRARLQGRLDVRGALRAGELVLAAELLVAGEVTAQRISGTFEGSSAAGPIRADEIDLRPARGAPWKPGPTLRTLRIEGNEVRLEAVTAEYVRAGAIYLGPGCRIARHDGTIVARHRSAVVGPSAVSETYPGLRR